MATENGGDPPVKGASFGGGKYDGGVKSFGLGSDGNLDTEITQLNMNSKTSASSSSGSFTFGGGGSGNGSKQPFDPYANCGHCHDHGVVMMDSVFDILGIALANAQPKNKNLAILLGGLAIVATKGRAAPSVLRAESRAEVYSVAYEMKLADNLYPGKSSYLHFKSANTSLAETMAADAKFAESMSELGVTIPRSSAGSILGKSPTNWVWHHDIGSGMMQLVPKSQHTIGSSYWGIMHPGGKGGMSWILI